MRLRKEGGQCQYGSDIMTLDDRSTVKYAGRRRAYGISSPAIPKILPVCWKYVCLDADLSRWWSEPKADYIFMTDLIWWMFQMGFNRKYSAFEMPYLVGLIQGRYLLAVVAVLNVIETVRISRWFQKLIVCRSRANRFWSFINQTRILTGGFSENGSEKVEHRFGTTDVPDLFAIAVVIAFASLFILSMFSCTTLRSRSIGPGHYGRRFPKFASWNGRYMHVYEGHRKACLYWLNMI